MTRSGELVLMDVEPVHSRWGNHGYKLVPGQEIEICRLLERLLGHD